MNTYHGLVGMIHISNVTLLTPWTFMFYFGGILREFPISFLAFIDIYGFLLVN